MNKELCYKISEKHNYIILACLNSQAGGLSVTLAIYTGRWFTTTSAAATRPQWAGGPEARGTTTHPGAYWSSRGSQPSRFVQVKSPETEQHGGAVA
mgnify:CR=1 FL=1